MSYTMSPFGRPATSPLWTVQKSSANGVRQRRRLRRGHQHDLHVPHAHVAIGGLPGADRDVVHPPHPAAIPGPGSPGRSGAPAESLPAPCVRPSRWSGRSEQQIQPRGRDRVGGPPLRLDPLRRLIVVEPLLRGSGPQVVLEPLLLLDPRVVADPLILQLL
jgi:hypothetical protein